MLRPMIQLALAAIAGLLIAGCKEQGPVELVDGGAEDQIEIVSPPPQAAPGMELGETDSAGIIPLPAHGVSGHLLVAGARYDGPLASLGASLGRAIFFDRSLPVTLPGNRLTFKTLDLGTIDLNGVPLMKVDKRVRGMLIDTLLGVQYLLYNKGSGGFQYQGGITYAWSGTGSGSVSPFTLEVGAPPDLIIETPTPSTVVRTDEDLKARWSGGGARVQLVISNAGDARIDSHPILHLRLGKNRGGALIPSRILKLLPTNRDRFVFTFFSDSSRVASIDGFPDDVLVEALTSHSILVRMTR